MSMSKEKSQYIELGVRTSSDQFIRNKVVEYSEKAVTNFAAQHNNTDVFTSVYIYDSSEIRNAKQTAPLYFDLDGQFAQDDLAKLIEFLIKHNCPQESLQIFFSGNKGFHLEVPFSTLCIKPSDKLNRIFEQVAKEINAVLHAPSLDTGIYDSVRLWRIPHSINSKSGLYKVPLSVEESKMPLEKVRLLAQSPRQKNTPVAQLNWPEFAKIAEKAIKRLKQPNKRGGIFEPVGEGQRNDTTFRRAIKLKAEGKTIDEAIEICSKIQDNPPLSASEIQRTVTSAYQEKYVVEPAKTRKANEDNGNTIYTSFYQSEAKLYEELFDPDLGEPIFACYENGIVSNLSSFEHRGRIIKPIHDQAVTVALVKLPITATEYGDEKQLFERIKDFIHTYVDIGEDWETWASYYVLLSWVYDKLPVCPYLCALGPSSTGKTRFVQTVGSICYKSYSASGSITASPIFRILDQFRGTLLINEFDHVGNYDSEIITILNNGYEKGFPAVRTEGEEQKQIRTFQVFGPKIFSSRRRKNDWAFESRLITIPMKETKRRDIPPFIDDAFQTKAQQLRNQLLMFRFRHYFEPISLHTDLFANIQGRLKQTLLSITSVINDEEFLQQAVEFAKKLEGELKSIKEFDLEAIAYQVLKDVWTSGTREPQLKDISEKVKEIAGLDKLTPKTMGRLVRDELGFDTKRGGPGGNYVIMLTENKLMALQERYEIEKETAEETIGQSSVHSVSPADNPPITEQTELSELESEVVRNLL